MWDLPPVPSPSAAPDPPANPGPYIPIADAAVAARQQSGAGIFVGLHSGAWAIYNGEYNKAILHVVVFGAIILGIASDLGESLQGY